MENDKHHTKLSDTSFAFIGTGVMAEAIIAGLLRNRLVNPDQIIGSHPREPRRHQLSERYGIKMFEDNRDAVLAIQPASSEKGSVVLLGVKPQRINTVLSDLKGSLQAEQVVVSIIAGITIDKISEELDHESVVRAMPNTPAQVGAGVTAWTATPSVTELQAEQVDAMFAALGKAIRVENERQIDMATALSATGPTYIFLVMEALIDAGVHLGFSRYVAKDLVQEMMLGSVLFARESLKHPAELRNMVTSPGGTSAEAIYQMEKGSLRTVLSKAVWAAYQRAEALGAASKKAKADSHK